MSVVGLSVASVWTLLILLMTCMPELTRPKIVCLPSKWGVGAKEMKNCTNITRGYATNDGGQKRRDVINTSMGLKRIVLGCMPPCTTHCMQ